MEGVEQARKLDEKQITVAAMVVATVLTRKWSSGQVVTSATTSVPTSIQGSA